jgi:transposase
MACWLCFILSRGNHRVSHVQKWAEQHVHVLEALTGKLVRALDFSDDRLASLLAQLGDGAAWPLGHSKDYRPDLAQVKISLSSLDPLGLPVSTTVVAGHSADDPLYEPEITRVRETIGRCGLLYVGDKKMAALETRALISSGGDYYLCPLGLKHLSESERQALIADYCAHQYEPQIVIKEETGGPIGVVGEIAVERTASFSGGPGTIWTERILAFSSFERAQSEAKKLDEAIALAQSEFTK